MNSLYARHVSILLIASTVTFVGYAAFAGVGLKPQIVSQESIQVIGIAASTNNAKESGPDAIIGKLWQRFLSESVLSKIPDKVEQSIYAVYTDYASDANGQYTLVLGAKVRPLPNPTLPEGMVVKTVPAGQYAVFTSERGPVAKVVVDAWKQIWSDYQSPANGERAYRADFELYDQRAADPNNAQVEIYIGVK